MIRRHFRTLLGVYTRRQRAAFAAGMLLWWGAAALLLLFSGTLERRILLLCGEYGEEMVRGVCFFLGLFLLFIAMMEYRRIVTGVFPEEDYAFYCQCGLDRRGYRRLRLLQAVPPGVLSLLVSCLLCFPLIGTGGGRLLFAVGWLLLLAAGCVFSYTPGQRAGRTGRPGAVRSGLLRRGRTGAMLAFSLSGAGKSILFLLLTGLGAMLALLSPSVWMACWPAAWLSYNYVIFTVNDYERQAGFHQMLPRTYGRLIRDDLLLSALYCGGILLFTGILNIVSHGWSAEAVPAVLLMFCYALSNHGAMYLLLEPMLPAEKLTDTFAPVLLPVVTLQLLPGFSLLLVLLLLRRRRKILKQPVPWGRRVC